MSALNRVGAAPAPGADAWQTARDRLVATLARATRILIRASGRGRGATLPGLLAERCAPGIGARAAGGLDRVVLVSGTNGKTTTTAMLTAALARSGRRVATNAEGSNLTRGLTAALLTAPPGARDAVLEVDEAALPAAADQLRPAAVVLLNLSRDQLDRHHEPTALAARWRAAAATLPPTSVAVAFADDPRAAWAAAAAPRTTLVRMPEAASPRDAGLCPSCGALLGTGRPPHAGRGCPRCAWRPAAATVVDVHRRGDVVQLDRTGRTYRARLRVATDGYALDAALAWTAAVTLSVDPAAALEAIAGLEAIQDRYAQRRWRGRQVRLLLAKNPAGWDEALAAATDRHRAAVIAVDAGTVDGQDTSWLWDVDMRPLRDRPRVVATGARAEDAALRLEAAGIGCELVRSLEAAMTRAGGRDVDLFADYTSFRRAGRLLGHG
ncbi:MAG TPA: MurT ligase domain-containing protein [Actinomycetes bacterium]|nr:MurT ligase domain-containing protein [Actinomycetes bacterium]